MIRKLILSLVIFINFLFGLMLDLTFANAAPTASELMSILTGCTQVSAGKFATDDPGPDVIPICGLTGAVYWTADMDIDCDGIEVPGVCDLTSDPSYQPMTSATDSGGNYLNAATLPFVVIPQPDPARFEWPSHNIQHGTVVAVIYNGEVEYGVFGDEAGGNFIGEASYTMASLFSGVDPDPATGGINTNNVTYIAFTGVSGVASPIESHVTAVAVGETRACQLINDNGGTCVSPSSTPLPSSSSTPLPSSSPSASSSPTPVPTPTGTPLPTGAPIPSMSAAPSAYVAPWDYGTFSDPVTFGSIESLVEGATGWILGFAASLILLMIIIGGLIYTTSAGDEQRMAWAKKIVIAALVGFVVIILSATIVYELKKVL